MIDISEHIPVLLVAIPILMAAVMIFLKSHPGVQNVTNLITYFTLLALSVMLLLQVYRNGIMVYEVGEWGKYGIILVADLLSSGMVVLTSVISLLALVYSLDYIEKRSLNATYHSLFNLLVAGLNGAFLTGDIFNMFVFFEILMLSSCGLVIANEKGGITASADKMEAAFKYLVLNILGSVVMLIAIALLYATVGTLNMADLSVKISAMNAAGNFPLDAFGIAFMFIVVFGNKAALFPLHYWLPDVHPTAPSPISAMLSGVMIKVGVYGILRMFFLIFRDMQYIFGPMIIFLALVTIIVGAVSAIGQTDVKRLLAYSSISQIGYIFLGIGMGTAYTIAAALVYLVNHAIAKSMLFMASGGIVHHAGTRDMRMMGGMINTAPLMGGLFFIGAMSIAGIPLTGGFIAKLVLFDAGLRAEYYVPIAIALFFAVFTLFYMFRAWITMFWGEVRDIEKYGKYSSHALSPLITIPIIILGVAVVVLGLYAEPLLVFAQATANQILNPQPYIDAVLLRVIR